MIVPGWREAHSPGRLVPRAASTIIRFAWKIRSTHLLNWRGAIV